MAEYMRFFSEIKKATVTYGVELLKSNILAWNKRFFHTTLVYSKDFFPNGNSNKEVANPLNYIVYLRP